MIPKSSEPPVEDKIARSIQEVFDARWKRMTNPIPVYCRNRPASVPTKRECIALTVVRGSKITTKNESGETVERQLGVVFFQIFTPTDAGLERATQIAGLISPVFGVEEVKTDSIIILFRPLEIIPVGGRKGYFQLNARVPFVADTVSQKGLG